MSEHVLPYDHSVVPQETFYDCGPASAQVVLNGRGVIESETDLIAAIGTTENGTNNVGLVANALNQHLADANYNSVYLQNDPPTQQQKDQLWVDITHSIDAGYGVVMNWDAPPGNHPIGVKGSQSPNYGGGEIMHYVPCMGYDDAPGARALWIADPGFRPFGYWISFEQAASLIPPKGYAYAIAAVPAQPDPAPPAAPAAPLSQNNAIKALYDAVPVISEARAAELVDAVMAGLAAARCDTVNRIAMWLGEIGEESDGFNATEEYASGAEYEGRADLGNTQSGDGVRFKGRSWIMVTGRSNYQAFSQWAYDTGVTTDARQFVDNPASLAELQYAGIGAAWYWVVQRPDINALADAGDIVNVTYRINGGQNGIADRRVRYQQALALGDELLALIAAPTPEGPLMALTDDEQQELLTKTREVWDQLRGPGGNGWPQLGTASDGNGLTPVDALASIKVTVEGLTKKAT